MFTLFHEDQLAFTMTRTVSHSYSMNFQMREESFIFTMYKLCAVVARLSILAKVNSISKGTLSFLPMMGIELAIPRL